MTRTVLITGASSGIGKALAVHYARERARLALLGRDQSRLAMVADECRNLGASVEIHTLDVRNRAEMSAWVREFDEKTPVDLVIANAGLMAGTPPGGEIEPADAGYAVVETNVLGVLNTIQPLLPAMLSRRKGQIAIISSIAAFIPLPDSPSYCASKSAVLYYGQSLRALLAPHGIGVSVVCPGYVSTSMAAQESSRKPFMMSSEKAAALIVAGLRRNRAVIAFPFFFAFATKLHGLLPDGIRRRLSSGYRFTVEN